VSSFAARWSSTPCDRIVFSRELSDAVPAGANPFVWAYLRTQADTQLAALAPRSLHQRVSEELARGLLHSEVREMTCIARAVGCSERTLRRALAVEGTSYRAVLDDLRRARAELLIQRGDLSVSEAAFEAGFSDASAFTHACQRWFGSAPRALAQRKQSLRAHLPPTAHGPRCAAPEGAAEVAQPVRSPPS
jgi:AraC-like DNA-binding protein